VIFIKYYVQTNKQIESIDIGYKFGLCFAYCKNNRRSGGRLQHFFYF